MSIRRVRAATSFLTVMLVLGMPADGRGAIIGLGFEGLVGEADVVARVRVLDVAELPPSTGAADKPNNSEIESFNLVNRKVSRLEIVDPIKGLGKKAVIRVEHDNGCACPNVSYEVNGEYLVFAGKIWGTDRYETVNFYEGSYRIEKGFIEGFYLFDEKQPQQYKKANAVVSDVRRRWWRYAATHAQSTASVELTVGAIIAALRK